MSITIEYDRKPGTNKILDILVEYADADYETAKIIADKLEHRDALKASVRHDITHNRITITPDIPFDIDDANDINNSVLWFYLREGEYD